VDRLFCSQETCLLRFSADFSEAESTPANTPQKAFAIFVRLFAAGTNQLESMSENFQIPESGALSSDRWKAAVNWEQTTRLW
jgi:hypothetical protein